MWNNPNKRKRPPGETQEPMVYDEKAAFDCFSLQRFEDIKKGLGWRKQRIDPAAIAEQVVTEWNQMDVATRSKWGLVAHSRQQQQNVPSTASFGVPMTAAASAGPGMTLPSIPQLPAYSMTQQQRSPSRAGVRQVDYRQWTAISSQQGAVQSPARPDTMEQPSLMQPSILPQQYPPQPGSSNPVFRYAGQVGQQASTNVPLSGIYARLGPYSLAQMNPELVETLRIRQQQSAAVLSRPTDQPAVTSTAAAAAESSSSLRQDKKAKDEQEEDRKPAARRIIVRTGTSRPASSGQPLLYSPQESDASDTGISGQFPVPFALPPEQDVPRRSSSRPRLMHYIAGVLQEDDSNEESELSRASSPDEEMNSDL